MDLLCPISIYGGSVTLLKFQIAPRLILLMSSDSKKKEPRYTCLCEAKASHSQRMWAEVSSSTPHLLHNGLSDSPIRWRCLLRVLFPVRRPVTALGFVLLKDRNLALAPRQGPEINSRACLQVSPRPPPCGNPASHKVLLQPQYLCAWTFTCKCYCFHVRELVFLVM
jgi:hypothetical protein